MRSESLEADFQTVLYKFWYTCLEAQGFSSILLASVIGEEVLDSNRINLLDPSIIVVGSVS